MSAAVRQLIQKLNKSIMTKKQGWRVKKEFVPIKVAILSLVDTMLKKLVRDVLQIKRHRKEKPYWR
jgi:hypothetical protein